MGFGGPSCVVRVLEAVESGDVSADVESSGGLAGGDASVDVESSGTLAVEAGDVSVGVKSSSALAGVEGGDTSAHVGVRRGDESVSEAVAHRGLGLREQWHVEGERASTLTANYVEGEGKGSSSECWWGGEREETSPAGSGSGCFGAPELAETQRAGEVLAQVAQA